MAGNLGKHPARDRAAARTPTRPSRAQRALHGPTIPARMLPPRAVPAVRASEAQLAPPSSPTRTYAQHRARVAKRRSPRLKRAPAPSAKIARPPAAQHFAGAQVVGEPSRIELSKAQHAGKLIRTPKGKVMTPKVARAKKELKAARAAAPRSFHDVGGIDDPEIAKAISDYGHRVDGVARNYGLSGEALLSKLIQGESNEEQGAVSTASAKSIAQFIPSTREDFVSRLGVDPWASKRKAVLAATMHLDGKHGYTAGLEGYNPGGGQGYVDYILEQEAGGRVKSGRARTPRVKRAEKQARAVGLKPAPDVSRETGSPFVYVRADAKGMVQWVKGALGTSEGSAKQISWADRNDLSHSDPWCANFVSAGLQRRGIKTPSNPNYVPAYEQEWADRNIGTDISKAKPGDLLTFSGEHIGVYVGNGQMISGNSSDAVTQTPVDYGGPALSAILRPPYKGGKVKVKAGKPLPEMSPTGTGLTTAPAGGSVSAAVAGEAEKGGPSRGQLRRQRSRKLRSLKLARTEAPAPASSSVLSDLIERYGSRPV